jgi:putative PIN family toxin of toxin-antitoxin system
VRVFPDTNVLASALGTRGLCADVLRLILGEHELVTGEIVIEELRFVLAKKFKVPSDAWNDIESFLRGYHVEPKQQELPKLKLKDQNDRVVVGSALSSKVEILVTGDQEILALEMDLKALRMLSPREFWNLAAGREKNAE